MCCTVTLCTNWIFNWAHTIGTNPINKILYFSIRVYSWYKFATFACPLFMLPTVARLHLSVFHFVLVVIFSLVVVALSPVP